ncbi:MAG: hypothetical protein JNL61_06070 [Rhizobiaceae bacterium]|nr:hypothetical protein [Rhizobiaceae bacterium]
MVSPQRLEQARALVAGLCRPAAGFGFCLFFSVSDGGQRARVVHAVAADFDDAWRLASDALHLEMTRHALAGRWLRIDWIDRLEAVSDAQLNERLAGTPRGRFRQGLCFDAKLQRPLLEQELNANAILQDGLSRTSHALLNTENLAVYAADRFGSEIESTAGTVLVFGTHGIFSDETGLHRLASNGPGLGLRDVGHPTPALIETLVGQAAGFLARQVDADGRFVYGYYPCFDRPIPTYNMVRHVGTIYAMIEAWREAPDPGLKAAIDRALKFVIRDRVAVMEDSAGEEFAMLVDGGREVKLGGNAVLVLALTEYARVFDAGYVLTMARRLARGIERMQDAATGRFVHVLEFPDLSIKEENRIVYYDGEAAFALVRLYGATGEERWLAMAERAAAHFTAAEYWRFRDHWIAYFTGEISLYRQRDEYFLLGIRNFEAFLERDLASRTMRPTFLELMAAADGMLDRLEGSASAHLGEAVDRAAFRRALNVCGARLLDSYFWPEIAMYFRKPDRILGSFFARDDSFRVRIDDVQHSISGLIAYSRIISGSAPAASPDRAPTPSR